MSEFSDVVDAIVSELVDNIDELGEAIVHRYAPWSPEEFVALANERHLAVWPAPEAEQVVPLVTNAYILQQAYIVAVWEPRDEEAVRGRTDEDATKALFDLRDSVRNRFFKTSNFLLASSDDVRPISTTLPDIAGGSRWFAVRIAVARAKDWTA